MKLGFRIHSIMLLLRIILVMLLNMNCINAIFDKTHVVTKYFQMKNVKNLFVINCDSTYNNRQLLYWLSIHGFITNILNPAYLLNKNITNLILDSNKIGIFLDTNCLHSDSLLHHFSSDLFNDNHKWLLFGGNSTSKIDSLSDIKIDINSDVIYMCMINGDTYELYDLYNTGRNNRGIFQVKYLGSWSSNNESFSKALHIYKYTRRWNMTGVVLKSMIVVTKKLNSDFLDYVSSAVDTHIDSMNRFNFALLLHLKDIYKFSYHMMRTKSWGYLHNGTFDGMIGQLERKLIDIGGSPIFFRIERSKVVDYTIQTWISRPCFIFRNPKRSSLFKIYVRPFDEYIWYCAIVAVAVIVFIMHRFNKLQNKFNLTREEVSLSYMLLFTIGVIFQQSPANKLHTLSGKIVMLTVCIFSILLYQFYSASIVSSLLMDPPRTINTLEDLLQSNLKAGIEDIIYNIDYFNRTTDQTAIKLYNKKISNANKRNVFNPYEGLKMVKKGGFAFHVDIATGYKIIRETFSEREVCELAEIQLFPPQRTLAIVQKGSPYRKLVTYGLRKISEVGLMDKQKIVWHEKKPACVRTPDTSELIVTIEEFSSALVFLTCGMLISIIILAFEMIVKRCRYVKPCVKISKSNIY